MEKMQRILHPLSKSHLEKTLESFSNESFFDIILRYSLFIGAIYQLLCIGACILLPPSEETDIREQNEEPTSVNGKRYRIRKQEKKKRR